MIPEAVAVNWARAGRLSEGALRVLIAFADFADEEGKAWPSARTLAQAAHVSDRSVRRSLGELERAGILEVVEVRRGGALVRRITPLTVVAGGCQEGQAHPCRQRQAPPDTSVSRTHTKNSHKRTHPPSGATASPPRPRQASLLGSGNDSTTKGSALARVVNAEVVATGERVGGGWPARLSTVWREMKGHKSPGEFGRTCREVVREHGGEVIAEALRRYLAGTSHPSPSPGHFAGEVKRWLPGGAGEAKGKPSPFFEGLARVEELRRQGR